MSRTQTTTRTRTPTSPTPRPASWRKLRVTTRPAPDVDATGLRVGHAAGVRLRLTRASKTKKADEKAAARRPRGRRRSRRRCALAACGAHAEEAIDEFVDRAFAFHAARLKRAEDAQGRYMFTPIPDSDFSGRSTASRTRRPFESLFFADKARVLKSLDTFEKKTGKYEIPGFPHKLGLLFWARLGRARRR